MQIEEQIESDLMLWSLERIRGDFRIGVSSLPGISAVVVDEVVLMFNLALLFVCISRPGKSLARILGEYCFSVNMRKILREIDEPPSPEAILEAGAGLDLVREYILDPVGCLDRISRWKPGLACPPQSDMEESVGWPPAYLCDSGTGRADHPWT